jgi:hypothetical protein
MRKLVLLGVAVAVLGYSMPAWADMKYDKPSAGTHKPLSVPEIRWCKRESIRADTMRDIVNTKRGREQLNKNIDDYNRRCVKYKYRGDDEKKAERDVASHRRQIVADASRDARELNKESKHRR